MKLTINIPVRATISADGDIDLGFRNSEAIKAVRQSINEQSEVLSFLMLCHHEQMAREAEQDREIEECLNRR